MERLRETLARKIGPFTVGVWLIIVVAGVGIGLLVRRGFGGRRVDQSGEAPIPAVGEGGRVPNDPAVIVVTGTPFLRPDPTPEPAVTEDRRIVNDRDAAAGVPTRRDGSGLLP